MRKHNEAFYNFSKLSGNQKLSVIKHADFIYLGKRKFLKYDIELVYSKIGDFFVEVWLQEEDNNIFNIFPFTTTKCLKPFLHNIDISDVYM